MQTKRDTVLEIKRAIARKTSLGTLELIYRCPKCTEKLSSQKEQVSGEDSCPTCGQRFSFSKRIKSNWERVNAEHNNSIPKVSSQGRVKQPSITENKINKVAVVTAGVLAITLCLVMVWDGESDQVIPTGGNEATAGKTGEPDTEPDKMTPETIADALKSVVHLRGDTGSGSGFLISDRLVVTNHHVVKGQAKLVATFHDGVEIPVHNFKTAKQNLDLAILILAKPTKKPALELEQEEVELYGQVYALGSPMGFDFSVSDGMVSACRKWSDITQVNERLKRFPYDPESDWIQFTAPLSQGNSGGPLINADGNVVGINTLASSAAMQNLNFAVDVNHLRTLIETLDTSDLVGHELASLPNEESNETQRDEEKSPVQNIVSNSVIAWDYAATITGDTFVDLGCYLDDIANVINKNNSDEQNAMALSAAHFALKQVALLEEKLGRLQPDSYDPATAAYINEYKKQVGDLSDFIRGLVPHLPTLVKYGRTTQQRKLEEELQEKAIQIGFGFYTLFFVDGAAVQQRLSFTTKTDVCGPIGVSANRLPQYMCLLNKWAELPAINKDLQIGGKKIEQILIAVKAFFPRSIELDAYIRAKRYGNGVEVLKVIADPDDAFIVNPHKSEARKILKESNENTLTMN